MNWIFKTLVFLMAVAVSAIATAAATVLAVQLLGPRPVSTDAESLRAAYCIWFGGFFGVAVALVVSVVSFCMARPFRKLLKHVVWVPPILAFLLLGMVLVLVSLNDAIRMR